MSPPNAPKVDGASVTAHGESSLPRLANRCRRTPFGENSSTNPLPGPAESSCFNASCLANVTNRLPPMLWSPNGAKPAGTFGSVKMFTMLKLLSKTSTCPKRKFVAYVALSGAEAPDPVYLRCEYVHDVGENRSPRRPRSEEHTSELQSQ